MDFLSTLVIELLKAYKDEINITAIIWVGFTLFIIAAYLFLKKHKLDSIASHGQITTNVINQLQLHASALQNELDSIRPHVIELGNKLESSYDENRQLIQEILELKSEINSLGLKYSSSSQRCEDLAFEIDILMGAINSWETFWMNNKAILTKNNTLKPPEMINKNALLVRIRERKK